MKNKMKEINFYKKIKDLRENDEWDREMTELILKKRNKRQIFKFFFSGGLFTITIIIGIYIWSSIDSYISNTLDNMITFQIDGTYNRIFNPSVNPDITIGNNDRILLDTDIDNIIENSLEMR